MEFLHMLLVACTASKKKKQINANCSPTFVWFLHGHKVLVAHGTRFDNVLLDMMAKCTFALEYMVAIIAGHLFCRMLFGHMFI